MGKKLHLVSLGCTKNLIDSEVMLGRLKDYEIIDDASVADLIIVNTCGFIESAKEESLNTIFNLHDQRKESSVLVMAGCLSQRYKDELANELQEVDIFTGVGDYDVIDELVEQKRSQFSPKVFLANDEVERVVTNSNYHAYIKLSEGCNQSCAFCAIPLFKGKLFSRTLESVKKELTSLVKQGFYDFSFVSQDSSSYLRDHGINDGLEQLIDLIDSIEGIKSARILYLYPSTTTKKLIKKIANSKVVHNYFDMPLQHISQNMLKVMKRGKGSDKIKELLEEMKKVPNAFIRTTFIVGHPGESEEDFEELKNFVKEFKFDRANVFSYSDEEGTSAIKSKQKVDAKIIDIRAKELGKIIAKTTKESFKKEVGKVVDVVVDGISDEHEFLLSAKELLWAPEIDGEILINDKDIDEDIVYGKIYKAKITEMVGDKLVATIL
ncbi:MAG: 30S ribosomal protein S12 methylthiotransferase RimO [Arcobacteraceae bacterium]|jgi:ribosomal protein S12 methylthiotransferase RimO|nr:30S ribosomal protein S12 methylthiotransferase RimO [Arcobacteraceae bacterium]